MALKKTVNHHKKKHCRKHRRSSSSGHSSGGSAPPLGPKGTLAILSAEAPAAAAFQNAAESSEYAGAPAAYLDVDVDKRRRGPAPVLAAKMIAEKIIAAGKTWVTDHAGIALYTGTTAAVAIVASVALSVARRR